mgnify:CR=1 FL=1
MKENISKIKIFLLLTFFLTSFLSLRAEEIKFNIGVGGYPPYMIVQKDKPPKGIMVEVLQVIASKYGHTLKIYKVPRKRVDVMMYSGKLDATPRAKEWNSRPDDFIFTNPIINFKDVLFSSSTNPLKFEKISDLYGKNLSTHLGYKYPILKKHFQNKKINRYDYNSEESMMEKVLFSKGRFNAAVLNEMVGLWIIKNRNWEDKFIVSKKHLASVGYRIMFDKRWKDFVKQFNRELETMKQNKQLDSIINKYIHTSK